MTDQYQAGPASVFATAARVDEKPGIVLSLLMSTFDGKTAEVIAIKRDEKGYYTTTYGRQTQEWIDLMNERVGVEKAVVIAYETCSLFGNWGNYDDVLNHVREAMKKREAIRSQKAVVR